MSAPNAARSPATIVLATHARPEFLEECVEGIVASLAPDDELIVRVCCNPGAATSLASFGPTVRVELTEHETKCTKLNASIRTARSPIVLITDDDCRVPSDWVATMVAAFDDPAVGVAFGPVVGLSCVPASTRPQSLPAGPAPPELWNFAHGASMAVRRRAIVDAGGFDERLGAGTAIKGGEEADVVLRMAARGWTTAVAPASAVQHLDWRDDGENARNLLGYQRGSGAYLGAGLRRAPLFTAKTFLLRLAHEPPLWRDRAARGTAFGPRMTLAFAGGLVRGVALRPHRYLAGSDSSSTREASTADAPNRRRTKVLWVTDETPDRDGGGGNIRQAMLLDELASRCDVTVLAVGRVADTTTRARVEGVIELREPAPRREPGQARRRVRDLRHAFARRPSGVIDAARVRRVIRPVLARIDDEFDVVVVHHLHLAPLVSSRRRSAWVLHLFDIASERARQERADAPGRRQRWLLRRETAHAGRYECEATAEYDRVVVVSDGDAQVLRAHCAESARHRDRVAVVPNGVAVATRTTSALPRDPHVLFPGTLNYRPNVLGLTWFCDEVLPLVQRAVPDVQLAIVGRRPVPEVVALAERPGIDLHPDVPQMAPWFEWARVVVVPLHVGTGTRLKALEAMAAARPVVGTSVGLESLGITDGVHARVVDEPSATAAAIVEILGNDATAARLAAAGRQLVEDEAQWCAIAARLADVLDSAAADGDRGVAPGRAGAGVAV
ncbi:MAG TPA: glycosyltransferase [Acidimicrobiia bacterium]